MNDLQDLTPEKVIDAEHAVDTGTFPVWASLHPELIVAAMHAALRWRREMEQTKRDEP